MKNLSILTLVCALSACQVTELPLLNKVTQGKAQGQASTEPMRPSGVAFDAAAIDVTDFNSCVGVGIVVPQSTPVQCIHDGVTYTGS